LARNTYRICDDDFARLTQSGPGHLLQSEQRQAQQHHSLPSHGGGHQDYGYMNDARWD